MRLLSLPSFLLLLCLAPGESRAAYFETSAPPREGDQYSAARYRLWLPPETPTVRGIIIRQHGCGDGSRRYGLSHANDLQWQELARRHGLALLGTELHSAEMCAQWYHVEGGSADALLRALDQLAAETNHPELSRVPWVLYGHSGGGYWCTGMLFRHPDRVLAAVIRSGSTAFMRWHPEVKRIPALLAAGIDDRVDGLQYAMPLTIRSFRTYRDFNAPWVVAIDPKGDHGNASGRRFYIPFVDAMLSLRLPAGGNTPREVDGTKGWQGDPDTGEIAQIGEKPHRNWAWFPDETLARRWQEFVRTGTVLDHTPPPAPFGLRIDVSNDQPTLTWDARIDLESGLKSFRIYRDETMIGEIAGQRSNYGDAPHPADIHFKWPLTSPGRYAVTAINHDDLESAPSESIVFVLSTR